MNNTQQCIYSEDLLLALSSEISNIKDKYNEVATVLNNGEYPQLISLLQSVIILTGNLKTTFNQVEYVKNQIESLISEEKKANLYIEVMDSFIDIVGVISDYLARMEKIKPHLDKHHTDILTKLELESFFEYYIVYIESTGILISQ